MEMNFELAGENGIEPEFISDQRAIVDTEPTGLFVGHICLQTKMAQTLHPDAVHYHYGRQQPATPIALLRWWCGECIHGQRTDRPQE